MTIEPTFENGAPKDPLAAMKSFGRTPIVDPASRPTTVDPARPTGAAAFVAREKVKADRAGAVGRGRAGPLLAAVGVLAFATALGAWVFVDAAPATPGSEASAPELAMAKIATSEPKSAPPAPLMVQADIAPPKPHAAAPAPSPAKAEVAPPRPDPVAPAAPEPSPVEAASVETPPPGEDKRVELAALEKERAAKANEIAESQKQIAALETRRAELQQQVAALSAPLSPSADEEHASPAAPPPLPPEKSAGRVLAPKPRTVVAQPAPPARIDSASSVSVDSRRKGVDRTVVASRRNDFDTSAAAEAPVDGYVRVFIHVQEGDPYAMERAEELAHVLSQRGVDVAGIRAVPHAVRTDTVRFFYDSDEAVVGMLGRAVATASSGRRSPPITQDFRNRTVAPRPGTLEIWLS